jgi:hypothetical protein
MEPEDGSSTDNFAPLRSLDWQVHVYGEASGELAKACADLDGYVALADATARPDHLKRYLDAHGIRAT